MGYTVHGYGYVATNGAATEEVGFFLATPSPRTKYNTKSNFGYPNFWVTK